MGNAYPLLRGGRGQNYQYGVIAWYQSRGPKAVYGGIYARWKALGGFTGDLGAPLTDESGAAEGGRFNHFEGGSIYWTPATGAHDVRPPIRDAWEAQGWERGDLGFPVSSHTALLGGAGHSVRFQGGTIYNTGARGVYVVLTDPIAPKYRDMGGSGGVLGAAVGILYPLLRGGKGQDYRNGAITWYEATGAFAIHGDIYERWQALDGLNGALGLPDRDEAPVRDGSGAFQTFNGGSIYRGPTGTWEVRSQVRDGWGRAQWEFGVLGWPTSGTGDAPNGGAYNNFEHGSVYWHAATGSYAVRTVIGTHWRALGGPGGRLGYPTMDTAVTGDNPQGLYNRFQRGLVIWHPATGAYALWGPILQAWIDNGAEGGALGFPTSDVRQSGTITVADFQGGRIYVTSDGDVFVGDGSLRQAVAAARDALDWARRKRISVQQAIAMHDESVAELRAAIALAKGDARAALLAEVQALAGLPSARALGQAQAAERAARAELARNLEAWVGRDAPDELDGLTTDTPIVLMPARIETRWLPDGNDLVLKIRIYPDEILAETHDERLSPREELQGQAYHAAIADGSLDHSQAFARLLTELDAPRAGWIVRATRPGAPPIERRPPHVGVPAEARCLPDRWIAVGYQGDWLPGTGLASAFANFRVASTPVLEPLALTPDFVAMGLDANTDPTAMDEDARWTVDFERAKQVGMALEVRARDAMSPGGDVGRPTPMTEEAWRHGMALLVVYGVRSSALGVQSKTDLHRLLRDHHYTEVIDLVPQGTATNNTRPTRSGASWRDDATTDRTLMERSGQSRGQRRDGTRLLNALGQDPGDFPDLANNPQDEHRIAGHMNQALWPVVAGWGLRTVWGLSVDNLAALQRLYVNHVRTAGPFPAFRVGQSPYGVLPVIALPEGDGRHWEPDHHAVELPMVRLLTITIRNLLRPATLNRTPRVRRDSADPDTELDEVLAWDGLADELYLGAASAMNEGTGPSAALPGWNTMNSAQVRTDHSLLYSILSQTGGDPHKPEDLPAWWLRHDRRAATLLDSEKLVDPRGGAVHAPALRTLADALRGGRMPSRPLVDDLLGRLLHHAATLVLNHGAEVSPGHHAGSVGSALEALAADVEPMDTEQLRDLMMQSLVAGSTRVDAWLTALASQRLARCHATHRILGAYSWVIDLRPGPLQAAGGHMLAPSPDHAATAAVLRSAYLSGGDEMRQAAAIDLSSAQVRTAQALLQGLSQGQDLGELLGQRLERGLHDASLDHHIAPLRRLCPPADWRPLGEDSPLPRVPPLVDGLRLWERYESDPGGFPWEDAATRRSIEPFLRDTGAALDALVDLLNAEAIYQQVRGNVHAAGAALAGFDGEDPRRPPLPQVSEPLATGAQVQHRVLLTVPVPGIPTWPQGPRAQAAPALDGWLGSLFGAPDRFWFRPAPEQEMRSAAQLSLSPLDWVAAVGAGDAAEPTPALAALLGDTAELAPPDAEHGLIDLLELARAARAVLGRARALRPEDLRTAGYPTQDESAGARFLARVEVTVQKASEAQRALTASDGALAWGLPAHDSDDAAQAALATRLEKAHTMLSADASGLDRGLRALSALFGGGFFALPELDPPPAEGIPTEWQPAVAFARPAANAEAVEAWWTGVAPMRPALREWSVLRTYAQALGQDLPAVAAQLPAIAHAAWAGGPGADMSRGALSLVVFGGGSVPPARGLMLDAWSESLPATDHSAGLVFNYDDAGNEAPQAVLVVVPSQPPSSARNWRVEQIESALRTTLAMAQIRALRPGQAPELEGLFPLGLVGRGPAASGADTNLRDLHDQEA